MIAHAGKIAKMLDDVHSGHINWADVDQLSVYHKGIAMTNKDNFNKFRAFFFKFNHFDADHTAKWFADFDKFFSHLFSAF
jgi:hypothetical protein